MSKTKLARQKRPMQARVGRVTDHEHYRCDVPGKPGYVDPEFYPLEIQFLRQELSRQQLRAAAAEMKLHNAESLIAEMVLIHNRVKPNDSDQPRARSAAE